MFKNAPHAKKMWQECKLHTWSSYLFLTLNKLFTKPVWAIKSLCYLFWHWFVTLSSKLLEVLEVESSHSSMLLQSSRWKWKGTSTRYFFKLSKKNLPHACFHNISTFCKWIFGKNKWKNSNITRNSRRSDILMLLTLLSADAKSTLLLRVPLLTKVQVHNF